MAWRQESKRFGGRMALALAIATVVAAGQAQAVDLIVTSTDDSGPGSLRQALLDATAGDRITFAPALAGQTITLTSARLDIALDQNGLTIDGDLDDDGQPDVTVEQTLEDAEVLMIDEASATIDGLVITGGDSTNAGGIEMFSSRVTVANSTITGNTGPRGGGIFGIGSEITITNSTITGNTGPLGLGGGIFVAASEVTITNSTISGNSSLQGGGVYGVSSGSTTITDSTISGNSAVDGGGIFVVENHLVNVISSTISGNSAADGGGIHVLSGGATIVINSTISGNTATNNGGGIVINSAALATVTNSTISGNSAELQLGGIALTSPRDAGTPILNVASTIISDNSNGDCGVLSGAPATITSGGFNLVGVAGCGLDAEGDIPNGMANLGLLDDNGGPTFTHALLPGSDAIDHIPEADCAVATDQRGVLRPQPMGGNCDIGAFELIDEPTGIADAIDLFDGLVAEGELVGSGDGASGPGRLQALRNMLLTADDLIAQGELEEACGQLLQVLRRIDGEPRPPDFAQGEGTADMSDALTALRSDLGCAVQAG